MIQKRIKFPNKENSIIAQRSISNKSKHDDGKIKMKVNNEQISRTNNLNNNIDFETNPIDSTITSVSTTTTNATKRIYIYRKNINKQKNSIRLIKHNSNNHIKNLIQSSSNDNINNNKKKSNEIIEDKKHNILENSNKFQISNKNDNYIDNYDTKINKNAINDTTPNNKYYMYNNHTFISASNIFKKGINLNRNNYLYNQNFFSTRIQKFVKKNEIINIEDILLLEEKFNDIKYALNNKSNIANDCFELINFYSQSSLFNRFENYFKDFSTQKTVHSSILIIIFDLILIYHVSFDDMYINIYYDYLDKIIHMNHQLYLLICDYISNKVSSSEKENIWVKKLRQMLSTEINHLNINTDMDFKNFIAKKKLFNSNMKSTLKEINYYVYTIQKNLTILLNNLSEEDDLKSLLIDIYNNIFEISLEKLYKLFKNHIFRIINKNGRKDVSWLDEWLEYYDCSSKRKQH